MLKSRKNKELLTAHLLMWSALAVCIVGETLCRYIASKYVVIYIGDYKVVTSELLEIFALINITMAIMIVLCVRSVGIKIARILLATHLSVEILYSYQKQYISSIQDIILLIGSILVIERFSKLMKELEKNEGELYSLAYTDTLTKLDNRRAFNEKIKCQVKEYGDSSFALVVVNIDSFKSINDTLGHEIGDRILLVISERWKSILREEDYMARVGGDEFTFILNNVSSKEVALELVRMLAGGLKDKVMVQEKSFQVTACFGIAMYPEDSTSMDKLSSSADMAMHYGKCQGKSRIYAFDYSMAIEIQEEVEVEEALQEALNIGGFFLVFQPQYETSTKRIRGYETLVRLIDKKGNIIRPDCFIGVAEKKDLISEVECWVIKNALDTFAKFRKVYDMDLMLGINISPKHLLEEGFIESLQVYLDETGYPPNRLEIEVTESVLINSVEHAITVLNALKKMGIHIALDDFGTGYASLSYLKKLPIDLLKIDKTFIDELESGNKEFVAAIISMAHVLHLEVISEGVENMQQLKILEQLNCNYIQGYVWGKPMRREEIITSLDV